MTIRIYSEKMKIKHELLNELDMCKRIGLHNNSYTIMNTIEELRHGLEDIRKTE
jgi:hypothetical protein